MSFKFKMGVITDEINPDLESALKVAKEWEMEHIELNSLWGKNVIDLSKAELETAKELTDKFGMKVVMVGAPTLKACALDKVEKGKLKNDPQFCEHMNMLKRSIELAHFFKTDIVRIFSFRKAGMAGLGNPSPLLPKGGEIDLETLDKIMEGMRIASDIAKEGRVIMGLENVRSCYGNSGENARIIIEATDRAELKAVWDPGNSYVSCGTAYPEGYESVKPHIVHIHVKDAKIKDKDTGLTSWEAIGAGDIDYEGQICALLKDGYAGVISLETHWSAEGKSKEDASRVSFEGLMGIVKTSLPKPDIFHLQPSIGHF